MYIKSADLLDLEKCLIYYIKYSKQDLKKILASEPDSKFQTKVTNSLVVLNKNECYKLKNVFIGDLIIE